MERLSPSPTSEPIIPDARAAWTARTFAYTLLALMLAGAAWIRFDRQIANVAPALAALAPDPERAAPGPSLEGLLELTMLPHEDALKAVAALRLPSGDEAAVTAALRRDRLRLVQLPLFDAGSATLDGSVRMVEVSSGGYSRLVQLSRQPVVVTLPIDRVGTITFRLPVSRIAGDTLALGALTATGPVQFQDLSRGQELDVSVVAQ